MKIIKNLWTVPTIAIIAMHLSACATIREVKKAPGKGGVIMVQEGIGGDARADAKQKMKENCGLKTPMILEEGEEVIGSKSHIHDNRSWWATSDTEDKREWRIKYKCKKSKS